MVKQLRERRRDCAVDAWASRQACLLLAQEGVGPFVRDTDIETRS